MYKQGASKNNELQQKKLQFLEIDFMLHYKIFCEQFVDFSLLIMQIIARIETEIHVRATSKNSFFRLIRIVMNITRRQRRVYHFPLSRFGKPVKWGRASIEKSAK